MKQTIEEAAYVHYKDNIKLTYKLKVMKSLPKIHPTAKLLLILALVCSGGLIAIAICTGKSLIFAAGFGILILTILFFIGVWWFRVEEESKTLLKDISKEDIHCLYKDDDITIG